MPVDQSANGGVQEQMDQACAELHRRLLAGEPCSAEHLLAEFPALASDDTLAVNLICTEYDLRRQLGQSPTPDDWYARFPQWQDQLRRHFQAGPVPDDCAPTQPATEPGQVAVTASDRPTTPPAPPPTLVRYELLEKLQVGGMGVVYRVRDTVLGREVALKMIRGGPARDDEVLRFAREAQAVARLRHRHIVPLYDFGEHDGQPFFTMAYVTGGSLAQHLDRFTDDVRAAVLLMEKVARAVQAAHDKGIIHRDLKPANVLLDEEGEPLVSDFGLAKFLGAEVDATHPGQLVGTPAYMAPEQAAGHGHKATAASDVWSLGVMLCELVTGQRPFAGQGQEAVRHILADAPLRPRAVRPGLDRALETIILQSLEKEPGRRYPSARDFAADLGCWLRGQPIRARPEGLPRRAWRTIRRRPALSAAVLVALLAAIGIPIVRHYADPNLRWRQMEGKLAAGEEVTLIGTAGLPASGYHVVAGAATVMDRPGDSNPAFTLSTTGFAMLELVSIPRRPHYRFRAEVQHGEDTDHLTDVGVYALCSRHDTARGPELCCCTLSFNDREAWVREAPDQPPSSTAVVLQVFRYQFPKGKHFLPTEVQKPFPPAGVGAPPEMPWRKLEVEVGPEELLVSWDGEYVGKVRRADLRQRFQEWKHLPLPPDFDNPEVNPEFSPEGGLGLWVRNGRGYFKNVVVTPLD